MPRLVRAGPDAIERLGVAPDENRPGLRLGGDVHAVLQPVVDVRVEGEGGGNRPAGADGGVDGRVFEPAAPQPVLGLQLLACGRRWLAAG